MTKNNTHKNGVLRMAVAACLTALLAAGCGGGASDPVAAQQPPVAQSARADGVAGAAVPIVPAAAAAECAAGADAPVRNSKRDCAP